MPFATGEVGIFGQKCRGDRAGDALRGGHVTADRYKDRVRRGARGVKGLQAHINVFVSRCGDLVKIFIVSVAERLHGVEVVG